MSWLNYLSTPPLEYGLAGIFLSAFLSATLLPGNSEIAVVIWLTARPETVAATWAVASLGNSLGSCTTYWLGRRLKRRESIPNAAGPTNSAMRWVKQYGYWPLLFAWLPVFGDGFCFAAGWLGLSPIKSVLIMLIGKSARYAILATPWLFH